MTTKHIPIVAEYFGTSYADPTPIITQAFIPGRGWKRYPFRKHISRSWARKMHAEGITVVALTFNGRTADFRIEELLRVKRTPLFTGNVIGAAVKLPETRTRV